MLLTDKIPTWHKTDLVQRLRDCILLLELENMISDKDRERIFNRLQKRYKKEARNVF